MQRERARVAGVRVARGHADLDGRSGVALPSHDARRPRHVRHRTAGARERRLLACITPSHNAAGYISRES